MIATLKIVTKTDKETNAQYFEGHCELPGLKSTRLCKADGCTRYATQSSVRQAAGNWAKKNDVQLVIAEAEARAAAKRAPRTRTRTEGQA